MSRNRTGDKRLNKKLPVMDIVIQLVLTQGRDIMGNTFNLQSLKEDGFKNALYNQLLQIVREKDNIQNSEVGQFMRYRYHRMIVDFAAYVRSRNAPLEIFKMNGINHFTIRGDSNECVMCGEHFTGWGNNPAPIHLEGRCCNECNQIVVARRIELLYKGRY